MGLLERITARTVERSPGQALERRSSIDQWISEYLLPSQFQFGGNSYNYGGIGGLKQTWLSKRVAEVSNDLPGYMAALRQCPPAFAAQMVRSLVLSQARFTFRNPPSSSTPRRTFGTRDLRILEQPWPSATTGELVSRLEWHAGVAGNAYVYRRPDRLRVLRPDWVAIVHGSEQEPEDAAQALDGELLGYAYCNGGFGSGNRVVTLLPSEVAHWCPLPDPEAAHIGMSWITPAIREIQGDISATQHKLQFFANGATPNMVVKGINATTKNQFDEIVDMLEANHTGVRNAYKTLYLTAGADATVVGSDLRQIDFKATQGAGETRITTLSRVPAPLLGISEGLAGSSLNAGNFGMARRMFADTWVYPSLQDLAASLTPIVGVPSGAELWFDTGDMPILREDAKDAAEITQIQASTVVSLTNAGFTPDSVKAAVISGNMQLLVHSGMLSVQLQPPGTDPDAVEGSGQAALPEGSRGRGDNDLKRYWLHGEGAGKWSTWTELYRHLKKHMPDAQAKRIASQWYHDRYGIWVGEKKGDNPTGPG